MTAEEKLAGLLDTMLEGRVPLSTVEEVARWMLARERAAVRRSRGKRLGFANSATPVFVGREIRSSPLMCRVYRDKHEVPGEDVVDLRVVAVPKPKKGGRR